MSSPNSLDFYDAELRAHHEHLRAAYGIGPGDEVLDIGCGTGLTAAERLHNVRYELGDAQGHRFDPAGFDVAISRFGTMFFSDPTAAFANIAAAFRPDARLVLLVWQRYEHNEWARAIDAAQHDTSAALASLSDGEAARTVERLRETLAAHHSDERGVVFEFAFLVDHGPATPLRR